MATPNRDPRLLAQQHVSQGNSDLFGIVGPELLWATQSYSADHCEQAFEHYDEAIRLDPNSYHVYDSRAYAYMRSGEYSLAVRDLTEVIALYPSEVDLHMAYRQRARAYVLLGMQPEAERDWAKQAELIGGPASESLDDYVRFEGQFPLAFQCDESGRSAS